MLEWVHSLRQILPDPVSITVVGFGIFLVLEAACKVVQYLIYIKSSRYVRDQWRRSRHWDEYRMLEYQQVWRDNPALPTLARLTELESLDRQQRGSVRGAVMSGDSRT